VSKKGKGAKNISIRQTRSAIGTLRAHREALRGLGLRRVRHEVTRADTPAVRGMVAKVPHLVEIVDSVEEKP
jgi:large subunit ribosomal protein L30